MNKVRLNRTSPPSLAMMPTPIGSNKNRHASMPDEKPETGSNCKTLENKNCPITMKNKDEMDIITTQSTVPQKSKYVALKKAKPNAMTMEMPRPTTKVGSAKAIEGPARLTISEAISRPLSARPKSKANILSELSKNKVLVSFEAPCAWSLKNKGRS